MKISIIITTFNRSSVLERLLHSLESQTSRNFEVVVAIDGSTDSTEQMLAALETSFPLKSVNTHCHGYGLAVARNMGILNASGELVVIIDDDCFPVPDFVASYRRSAKRMTITGGLRTPSDTSDERQVRKMEELKKLPSGQSITFAEMRRSWPNAVATECNICMYREDIIGMGLFSERLKIYGFIGQEFYARAEHFGLRYQFDPQAEIIHHRQLNGDNSLTFARKKREVRLAMALRPSMMIASQYTIQKKWAKDIAESYPILCPLPPLPLSMWLIFPYRFLRNRIGDIKRKLRSRGFFR